MAPQTAHSQSQMRTAAGKINDACGDMQSLQNQLRGHQAELGVHWRGQAAITFAKVYRMFDDEFTKVITDLRGIHERLEATTGKYFAQEQQTTDDIRRLHGIINT